MLYAEIVKEFNPEELYLPLKLHTRLFSNWLGVDTNLLIP